MSALARAGGVVSVTERATPRKLTSNGVLVRVAVAGLCRTDCLVADGRLAVADELRVLGHELSGTVIARGTGVTVSLGTVVNVDPRISCGDCPACDRGQLCGQPRFLGVDLDGAFAEYLRVPAASLVPALAGLDPRAVAYTEPVAAALAVLDTGITPDQRGLVVGSGRIAALTLAILRAHDFDAVEPHRV